MSAVGVVVIATALFALPTGCGRLGFDAASSTDGDAGSDPNDVDGDGVVNADDNCPMVANPTQANEDGDAFGDACDPCPPFADTEPPVDSDSDGVGDACDPSPNTPGDTIVTFEGFSSDLPDDWTSACTWTISGGVASIVSADGLDCWLAAPRPASAGDTVSAQVVVDQLFGTSFRHAGVVDAFDTGSAIGVECALVKDTGNANELEILDGSGGPLDATAVATIQAGTTTTMTATRTGNSYACEGSNRAVMASTSVTAPVPQAGIRTLSTSAHFQWVLVVSH